MLLKASQSVSRFRLADLSFFSFPGWRETLSSRLEERHFSDEGPVKVERSGFVDPWHLSTVTFEDSSRWRFDPYLVIGYRIDRRTVPANLFNSVLQSKIAKWCAEHSVERAPASVRAEMKESLKEEWIRRALPKVKHLQLSISTSSGDVYLFGSCSESDSDRIRRSLFEIFGSKTTPWIQSIGPEVQAQIDSIKYPLFESEGASDA